GGRVVLITGGSAGIGKAAAMRIAEAGARTIIVGRDQAKLDEARKEAQAKGFDLITYSADLSDPEQCGKLAVQVTKDHGGVDVLVNNAGRSIRRGIENSYDRMHDFDRTMAINYFGALHLTMGLLPGMSARKRGHVVNISSIGVLTNAPRFSAYVASKAALDAWTRCAASEFLDRHIHFTTINMPLVATDMTAPTSLYKNVPMLSTDEAADFIVDAIIHKQSRIATRLGILGQVINALTPRFGQIIMNTTFRMFPDSAAAKGKKEGKPEMPNADQIAFTQLLRGLHF
ncbi:MAG TPA: SDR family NAD(P)-dependent oxidoreductase, partial [Rhodoblastus sp.]|nr:SDR family NAD(P)-dependent oxidoreductase [Rhodoblastus sp.]